MTAFFLRITERQAFVLLLGLAAIIRFSAIYFLDIEPFSDAGAYMRMARSLFSGGPIDDGLGNVAFYSSGYPLLLSPFYGADGGGVVATQVINALMGVAGGGLVFLCARQVLVSWRWAALCALAWIMYPPAIAYTEYIAKENLMVLLLLLQLYVLLRLLSAKRIVVAAMLFGLVFGAGLLTGPAIVLTGLLFPFVLWKNRQIGRRVWAPMLSAALGCLLVIGPWLGFTYQQLGTPVLNTNGGFNLYLGNNDNGSIYFEGIQETPLGPQWAAIRSELGEVGASKRLSREAIDYMLSNPGTTLMRSLTKAVVFWTPPFHADRTQRQSRVESLVRGAWMVTYCVAILLFLAAIAFSRRWSDHQWTVALTILFYCALHGAAYIIFRYRLPVMPMVFLMAAVGAQFLVDYWRQRRMSDS